ncbi:hypothetical protein DNTS_024024, partial [Danionella cerebrum]
RTVIASGLLAQTHDYTLILRMGAAFKKFCVRFCCCCCCEDDDEEEKTPLITHDTLEYFDREAKKRRDQETNLWSEPGDSSHTERDDDRALHNLLQSRAKTQRGSQGYRRLSIDIEAMRDMRREVRDKWKMILENLGFMAEADSLLTVSASASYDRMRNASSAQDFVAKARRFYPPRDDDDDDEEENPNAINLPLLLSRMNQNISGAEDDNDEASEAEN